MRQCRKFHDVQTVRELSPPLLHLIPPLKMASVLACSGLTALPVRAPVARRSARVAAPMALKKEAVSAASVAAAFTAAPAMAAQEVAQVAMETNILGLIATALFVIIPTSFLIVLFVKSESDGARSGGFSQEYYNKSKTRGRGKGGKITNESAIMKGKGLGMYSDD